jgi:hypothetical protein
MTDNIDLTEKQIHRLKNETKHLSANATDGDKYVLKYPGSRNGYYSLIITQLDLTESHLKSFQRISRKTGTNYMLSVNKNRLELRFYAGFGKLPRTLI